MRFDNKSFFHEKIVLDGNEYHGCTFLHCELMYCGGDGVVLHECLFKESNFGFGGPAAKTMKFLEVLYHGLGEPGVRLVEQTFTNIRLGKICKVI